MRFVTRPIEALEDPLSLAPDTVWMSPETSLWGWGEAARIRPGPNAARLDAIGSRFREILTDTSSEFVEGAAGGGPAVISSITFAEGSPGSVAIVPEILLRREGSQWWLTSIDGRPLPPPPADLPPPVDRARYAGSSVPDVRWLHVVAEAIEMIQQGRLAKVVLARDYGVWSRQPLHPPRLLRHLHGRFPSCHVYSVAGLVGASPELLVRRRGTRFESVVLAGSAPRHPDPVADRAAGEALLDSKKDLWEHELAVRSVAESLELIGVASDVARDPRLLHLDNVQHLATDVEAEVPLSYDALRLAGVLHPTAAVGGTPTPAALEVIKQLEGMDRGRYAGPVGWMDTEGDGEFAIALRCAELSGARARLFAGAGIVADSLPEAELEETRVKLGAMMGALAVTD